MRTKLCKKVVLLLLTLISITDNGTGISKENLTHIFDPYFTTKVNGSGLGLATSYSIINNHQGHINVTSEIGQGTTFSVYLPLGKDIPTNFIEKNKINELFLYSAVH